MTGLRFGALLGLGALLLSAQELREYERKVTEFTLPNGLHFILLERHQLPVVSFHTYVNVGSAQDPAGQTGMAHLFEHLAFKGTESVGTKDWATEKKALQDVDDIAARLEIERNRGARADIGKVGALEVELRRAVDTAQGFGDPEEFTRVIQQNGGVGLTCHTTPDAIETSYNLPSNRIELWFLMESQRLAHPVFRDFYRERDALLAENRNDVDAKELPRLRQALLATAFAAHRYRNPGIGWPSDIANLRLPDARAFFDTYFVPSNIAIGIVGDVDPANARRLADRYFGGIPAKAVPTQPHTVEPLQVGPKTVSLVGGAPPLLLVGYKRPAQTSRDDVVFDVIRSILADGRTSWMYQDLVENKRVAQMIDATATYPAGRSVNLFVFTVMPARDRTLEENQQALYALLERIGNQPVDAQTLDRVKNVVRTRIARVLGDNQQLSFLLTTYYSDYGDWRKLFTNVDAIQHVTPQDIQRVALQYFIPAGRTVATFENPSTGAVPPPSRGPQ